MKLLNEVKEEFFFTTYNIDQLISKYLIRRLGVQDIETINALGLKGRMTFQTRLDLLMQIKWVSNTNKRKLEIYSKLYQSLMLKKGNLIDTNEADFEFLLRQYPQASQNAAEQKVGTILKDFVLDVQHIIEKISKIPTLQIMNDSDTKKVDRVIPLPAL